MHRRGLLEYEGLPWRGEVWFNDKLRLGPPTRQDETALIGPRVILVDAMVDCVGLGDAPWVFEKQLRELAAFLSVVMGTAVQIQKQSRIWTWTFSNELVDCVVRQRGYYEQENQLEMPVKGACHSMPLRQVRRPDFSIRGIDASTSEKSLPSDSAELWDAYVSLADDQRRQFLQAAAKWQESLILGSDRRTLSFALMVVACEALKPPAPQYREHNIYDVIEALLGKHIAEQIQQQWFHPQGVRNAHLHSGEFRGSEFIEEAIMSSYEDPTFDQATRALAPITQEAIIEWLRQRGRFAMPLAAGPKNSFRRWVRKYAFVVLAAVATAGVALGWLLRMLTYAH